MSRKEGLSKRPRPRRGYTLGFELPEFKFTERQNSALRKIRDEDNFIVSVEHAVREFLGQKKHAEEAPRPGDVVAALRDLERSAASMRETLLHLDAKSREHIEVHKHDQMHQAAARGKLNEHIAKYGGDATELLDILDTSLLRLELLAFSTRQAVTPLLHKGGKPSDEARLALTRRIGEILRASDLPLDHKKAGVWARTLNIALVAVGINVS